MPELPEVETICRGLRPFLQERTLQRLSIQRSDLRIPLPQDFARRLQGRKICLLNRRSKYILLHLEGELTWVMHLGMSGRLCFFKESPPLKRHDHVLVELASRQGYVVYHDPRRFGLMTLVHTATWQEASLFRNLGPEPLEKRLTADKLHACISQSRRSLKIALLDQTLIAGLGNIYVCEILWRAHLSPWRPCHTLTLAECDTLLQCTRHVLEEAITAGGSTLKDYQQPDGRLGYFQHCFQVYNREGLGCLARGCTQKIKRLIQAGRSTFYCFDCQAVSQIES